MYRDARDKSVARHAPHLDPRRRYLEKEKRQTACKPGSVQGRCRARYGVAAITHARPAPVWPFIWDVRCRTPHATYPRIGAETPARLATYVPSYLVLLPVGFAVPLPLPVARCALTAPFHPCRSRETGGLLSVALSLGLTPAGRYPAPFFRGARTFLPCRSKSGHPAIWLGGGSRRLRDRSQLSQPLEK